MKTVLLADGLFEASQPIEYDVPQTAPDPIPHHQCAGKYGRHNRHGRHHHVADPPVERKASEYQSLPGHRQLKTVDVSAAIVITVIQVYLEQICYPDRV